MYTEYFIVYYNMKCCEIKRMCLYRFEKLFKIVNDYNLLTSLSLIINHLSLNKYQILLQDFTQILHSTKYFSQKIWKMIESSVYILVYEKENKSKRQRQSKRLKRLIELLLRTSH